MKMLQNAIDVFSKIAGIAIVLMWALLLLIAPLALIKLCMIVLF